MSLFQIILLIVCAWLVAATGFSALRGWIGRRLALVLTVIWASGAAAVTWPDTTSKIAGAVGIGRGTDLVLYCAIVVVTIAFFLVMIRLRRLQQNVTALVRRLAMLEAVGNQDNASSSGD